jgi:hypothetical protein
MHSLKAIKKVEQEAKACCISANDAFTNFPQKPVIQKYNR